MPMDLDQSIRELAARYRPLAEEFLKEAIRIPEDHVDREPEPDPSCGLSNHEGPRLEYLKRMLVEHRCVAKPDDAWFDDYGNLVWTVQNPDDGVAPADKTVVYFDGHSDTVQALRDQWRQKIGEGMDCYQGLVDPERIDREFIKRELGYVPPEDEWDNVIFGRGSADQLGGVIGQMIATKIMLELASQGALDGVIVRSYATAAEEDNDGGGPMFLVRHELPGAPPERIPDAVVLTEGTGDASLGSIGIYRGQRGRMQIEVDVVGRSCHGSMPWEGLNPLEFGAAIIVEARAKYDAREGFLDHEFLSHGTRTASFAHLETPSDCAVPERFTFRFDRRLTLNEEADQARRDIDELAAVATARKAGLTVEVRIPRYDSPTWRGFVLDNEAVYPGWMTPPDHPAIQCAVDAYERVVSPAIPQAESDRRETKSELGGGRSRKPRVDRWIFSTDGVGFQVPAKDCPIDVPATKRWVTAGNLIHPAMFGFGPGIEQNTHKIGECVDARELESVCALLARFPTLYAQSKG
jgi:putative selenium metabolism hydrolase